MTEEFQVCYDPNHMFGYPYYLGFESLLDSELIEFHKAVDKHANRHFKTFAGRYYNYLNVIEHNEFRKFSFYIRNWALAPVDNENPGLVIDNCDMLPNKNELILNTKLEFKINTKMLPKIREELLKINQLDRLK